MARSIATSVAHLYARMAVPIPFRESLCMEAEATAITHRSPAHIRSLPVVAFLPA